MRDHWRTIGISGVLGLLLGLAAMGVWTHENPSEHSRVVYEGSYEPLPAGEIARLSSETSSELDAADREAAHDRQLRASLWIAIPTVTTVVGAASGVTLAGFRGRSRSQRSTTPE
ncbi:hypothetical protein [Nocardia noduli]|uniref:hypothetical protein n=1 Tax=Nocardia noduli TaxID=2815722 RepID=UPI001C21307F|nr:hypothetical protein [Nocardia noduli]